MNDLTAMAILVLIGSIGAMFWGGGYLQENQMQALFNADDPSIKFARTLLTGGFFSFFIGIAMLIGGLVRSNQRSK